MRCYIRDEYVTQGHKYVIIKVGTRFIHVTLGEDNYPDANDCLVFDNNNNQLQRKHYEKLIDIAVSCILVHYDFVHMANASSDFFNNAYNATHAICMIKHKDGFFEIASLQSTKNAFIDGYYGIYISLDDEEFAYLLSIY